jgi:uncharacterized protein (UPF0264 family)
MRLLVSVRSAEEALAAVDGGADVVDAKDPEMGALGAVRPSVLSGIRAVVPSGSVVTAALGDAWEEAAVERLAREYASRGAELVKVGFAGVDDVSLVERLVAACVRGCDQADRGAGVVAVAYADASTGAGATGLLEIAARAGARGVLIDTAAKEGPGLRALWSFEELSAWIVGAHERGLLAAVAGKLVGDDLAFVSSAGADVAGVRGAACVGGRGGNVSAALVRALRDRLASTLGSWGPTADAERAENAERRRKLQTQPPGIAAHR